MYCYHCSYFRVSLEAAEEPVDFWVLTSGPSLLLPRGLSCLGLSDSLEPGSWVLVIFQPWRQSSPAILPPSSPHSHALLSAVD